MGGGATLPTASTPGYTLYKKRVTCECLAKWLDAAERLGLARGLIKFNLDIVQLTGGNPLSGGTHTKGGAADLKQNSNAWIALYREMGAAAWRRDGPDWEGNEHCHLILIGCEHNGPGEYQVIACKRGYNGLGKATSGPYAGQWGYGGKDPHPAPKTWRTWSQGIAWAEAQIKTLTQEEDIMATKDELREVIHEEVGKAVWRYGLVNRYTKATWTAGAYVEGGSIAAVNAQNSSAKALATATATLAAVKALADAQGQDGAAIEAIVKQSVDSALAGIEITLKPSVDVEAG